MPSLVLLCLLILQEFTMLKSYIEQAYWQLFLTTSRNCKEYTTLGCRKGVWLSGIIGRLKIVCAWCGATSENHVNIAGSYTTLTTYLYHPAASSTALTPVRTNLADQIIMKDKHMSRDVRVVLKYNISKYNILHLKNGNVGAVSLPGAGGEKLRGSESSE